MLFDVFKRSRPPQTLPFHTDIHCHVVPGVDDGSPDVDTSMQLLEHMSDWGLKRIFASPHSTQDTFENTPRTLAEPYALLSEAVRRSDLGIELHLHMEYRVDTLFIAQFEAENLIHLPGKHLLVENPFSNEPYGFETLMFNVRSKGYTPILAHPERYRYYSERSRHRYHELHEYGILFQINLLSLAGHYGKLERETALYMLKQGLVQYVGTDLHRESHVRSIEAYLRSSDYRKDLKLLERVQNDSL